MVRFNWRLLSHGRDQSAGNGDRLELNIEHEIILAGRRRKAVDVTQVKHAFVVELNLRRFARRQHS